MGLYTELFYAINAYHPYLVSLICYIALHLVTFIFVSLVIIISHSPNSLLVTSSVECMPCVNSYISCSCILYMKLCRQTTNPWLNEQNVLPCPPLQIPDTRLIEHSLVDLVCVLIYKSLTD